MQLSPQAAARLIREERKREEAPEVEELTPSEMDVLQLVAQGLANKEIAFELGIGEKTVKTHVSSILGRLDVLSRTQAAVYAVQKGWVSGVIDEGE